MRKPLYDQKLVGISASIPIEYKQVLQVLGGGIVSNGIRTLVERLAPEEVEELKVIQNDIMQKVEQSKALREKISRPALENLASVPKKGSGIPNKKKRKRPTSR